MIKIRPMTALDAELCTSIHSSSFKGFFLTFLGPRFLKELYTDIAIDPTGIAFVAENEVCIAGFVAGTTDAPELYRNLIRNHLRHFAMASIGAVVRKPTIIPRLLRALRKPSERLPVPNVAILMSIAVSPNMQGLGAGQHLVRAFFEEASNRGREHVMLSTDAIGNDSTNDFYRHVGFTLLRTYTTPEGRVMNEYIYNLPAQVRVTAEMREIEA